MLYAPKNNVPEVPAETKDRPKLAALCEHLCAFRENALESLKPYFDDALQSGELRGILDADLAKLADDPMHANVRVVPKRYQVFLNDNYSLRLLVEEPRQGRRTTLTTAPSGTIWGVISADRKVAVDKYKLPEGTQIHIFDPSVELEFESREELTSSDKSTILKAAEVFSVSIDHRVVILALTEVPALPYVWEFDRETLKPLLIQSVAPSISRLEVAINALSSLSKEEDITAESKQRYRRVIENLTENSHHFIRWKATQALFKIDREHGEAALERASHDPHPHVRQAALASLARISQARAAAMGA